MNLLFSLPTLFPFLDLVITPRSTPTPSPFPDQVIDPQSIVATPDSSLSTPLLFLFVLFLIFIGCLIWSALRKKK